MEIAMRLLLEFLKNFQLVYNTERANKARYYFEKKDMEGLDA